MSRRRTQLTLLLTAVAAVALPGTGTAGAEVLFDQVDPTPPQSTGSQDFEPAYDTADELAADDFEVPRGEVWQLQAAFVDGVRAGQTSTGTFNVHLFANAGSLPGAEVLGTSVQANPGPAYPDVELPLTAAPILDAGAWWFAPQARLDGVSPMNPQQWFRAESDTGSGATAAWRNPGGGIVGHDCFEFTPRDECPLPLPGGGTPEIHPAPGQSFRLEGNRAGAELSVELAKAKGKGKLALTVNVPDGGELTASSKQLKGAGETVEAIGDAALTLKPKGKTKRALADGKRIKAKVELTLSTAGGGTLEDSARRS